MIYSHKPQRSGKSIAANTNNPPQDPPPPPKEINDIPKVSNEIPDILISDTTPPVIDVCQEIPSITIKPKIKQKVTPPKKRFTFLYNIITKIQKFFKRCT